MGSWNMSCALTGVSIGCGDEAVVVLCENAQGYGHGVNFEIAPTTYLHGEEGGLSAIMPGVRGTYEDYGILEWDLEDNPVLADFAAAYDINFLIEPHHHSGKDTDDLVEATKAKFPNGVFAVWIHAGAWDQALAHRRAEGPGSYSLFLGDSLLQSLGFTNTDEIDFKKYNRSFNRLYTREDWPDHGFACEGWSGQHVVLKDGRWVSGDYTCTLPDVIKIAKKYGLLLNDINPEIESLRAGVDRAVSSGAFLSDKRFIKFMMEEAEDPEQKAQWAAQLAEPPTYRGDLWGFISGSRYGDKTFCDLWAQKLVDRDPVSEQAWADFQAIHTFFYCVGRLFAPTVNGPQCGEPRDSLALANITRSLAQERIEELEDDWDDESEE